MDHLRKFLEPMVPKEQDDLYRAEKEIQRLKDQLDGVVSEDELWQLRAELAGMEKVIESMVPPSQYKIVENMAVQTEAEIERMETKIDSVEIYMNLLLTKFLDASQHISKLKVMMGKMVFKDQYDLKTKEIKRLEGLIRSTALRSNFDAPKEQIFSHEGQLSTDSSKTPEIATGDDLAENQPISPVFPKPIHLHHELHEVDPTSTAQSSKFSITMKDEDLVGDLTPEVELTVLKEEIQTSDEEHKADELESQIFLLVDHVSILDETLLLLDS